MLRVAFCCAAWVAWSIWSSAAAFPSDQRPTWRQRLPQRASSKFLFAYGPVAILTRSGVTEDLSLSFLAVKVLCNHNLESGKWSDDEDGIAATQWRCRAGPAIDAWMKEHAGELGAIARQWFEVMRKCGDDKDINKVHASPKLSMWSQDLPPGPAPSRRIEVLYHT
jgi:hypothetical protein